jgi:hypothetical protein
LRKFSQLDLETNKLKPAHQHTSKSAHQQTKKEGQSYPIGNPLLCSLVIPLNFIVPSPLLIGKKTTLTDL